LIDWKSELVPCVYLDFQKTVYNLFHTNPRVEFSK